MEQEIKQLSQSEISLAYAKHFALEHLKKYIEQYEEDRDEYCEYKDSWMNEFYECETENDIHNFIRHFKLHD